VTRQLDRRTGQARQGRASCPAIQYRFPAAGCPGNQAGDDCYYRPGVCEPGGLVL